MFHKGDPSTHQMASIANITTLPLWKRASQEDS